MAQDKQKQLLHENAIFFFSCPHLLHLYCGCGNFSLFLAREGAVVTGIDSSSHAVKEAIYNAELNNTKNCSFIKAELDKPAGILPHDTFQSVLLNPPRSGCSKRTLKQISDKNPDTVVYVSCNPSTLARDLQRLVSSGCKVEEIQPLDMFPQTYHIETIVKLVRM